MGTLCRLCKSDSLKLLFNANHHKILKCLNCDFVQIEEEPSAIELSLVYGEAYFTHQKYRDLSTLLKENIRRLGLISQFVLDKEATVLDAGCATGDFIHYAKNYFKIFGFDQSEFAVALAKEKNPEIAERIWAGNIQEFNECAHRFDVICLWDVIEHLRDPLSACRQLVSLLKPGGYLLISSPAIDAPIAKFLGKYWAFMTPPEHLSFFGKKSIHYIFEEVLQLEIVKYFRKGKWSNLGFVLYKIGRVAPALIPNALLQFFQYGILAKMAIYVPTGDIQYLVMKKR
jgi:2-polyprenyl-3-methyl-5-hydroxy-6-metoxy-1,4-benzoquinol methylase